MVSPIQLELGATRVDLLRKSEFTSHFSESEYRLKEVVLYPRSRLGLAHASKLLKRLRPKPYSAQTQRLRRSWK